MVQGSSVRAPAGRGGWRAATATVATVAAIALAGCAGADGKLAPDAGPAVELRDAYRVQGMDADGTGYAGRLELAPAGEGRYRLTGVRGGDTIRGVVHVVRPDSILLLPGPDGSVRGLYVHHPDGHLEGRWRAGAGASGWEVLRPFDRSLPPPDVRESFAPAEGTIRIGPGPDDLLPRTDVGHALIRPADRPTRAVAVFFDGFRVREVEGPFVERSFEAEALRRGVAILRVTTGDPLDFLFTDSAVEVLLDRVSEALRAHGLDRAPLLFTGLSLGGTRAARAAVHLARSPARWPALDIRALAVVDAPLDLARLYRAEVKAIRDDFHPAAAGEGRWVTYRLRTAMGGEPDEAPAAYAHWSPVSADEGGGENVAALAGLAVRAYHEPDIDWWIAHRGKTYGQMNSPDLALMIERLRALGSEDAELVTSHRRRDGWAFGATPHTWSFVDDAALVDWFLGRAGTR